ncbi:cupin domain-containing protein [Streptosporangium sp. NPDC051022]|uniref:homogentisate 1,2-dioxygenase n=1 Tax=Streptosporangium sp. NPDC051022 TaxID=3155752 RepID=UPI003438CD0F
MPYFTRVGDVPRKRFSQFRRPDGGLYATEVMGEEGFSSDMSLLFHKNAPTGIAAVTPLDHQPTPLLANRPLLPRLFHTSRLKTGGDAVLGRHTLVGNQDVTASYTVADTPSPLYRNAVGDELTYIHEGEATVETVFGTLTVGKGDYVIIPTSATHRWIPTGDTPLRLLTFETTGHIHPPKRYLTRYGQLTQEAPFFELDLRRPDQPLLIEEDDVDVLVKNRDGLTRYTMERHPFDVVGWFGCNYPFAFNIDDFSPITGSFHRPPPVHQTFEAPNVVFCNFVPRMLDYDPRAVPIPSYHSNVDSDEFLFYAEGNFFSRGGSGIERGSISLHPAGHIHGPQPGAVEKALERIGQRTSDYAVMLDTFRPLHIAENAFDIEDPRYITSWSTRT